MARVNNTHPIADIHGALSRSDKVVFRVRDGIQQAYIVKHPYEGEPSRAQAAQRSKFKTLTQQVKAIYADPEQLNEWKNRFSAYTSTPAYKKALERYLASPANRNVYLPSLSLMRTKPPNRPPRSTVSSSQLSPITHNPTPPLSLPRHRMTISPLLAYLRA